MLCFETIFHAPRGKVLNHKFHNPITEVCCTSPGPHCGPEGRRKEEERKGRGSMDQEKRHFHHERERGESPIHPEGNSSGSAVLTAIVLGEETISPWFLAKKAVQKLFVIAQGGCYSVTLTRGNRMQGLLK